MPRAVFQATSRWDLSFGGTRGGAAERAQTIQLADVDGDRRADLCGLGKDGVVCALATTPRAFATPRAWSAGQDSAARLLFGDVDGDGKADVCVRASNGHAACETRPSTGATFAAPRVLWLAGMTARPRTRAQADGIPRRAARRIALADVDGDRRADACGRGPDGIHCALSRRTSFAPAERWSSGTDFADGDAIGWGKSDAYGATIRFGDLNGDGRADVCGRGPDGVVCALSSGRGFTKATLWLRAGMTDGDGWLDDPARRSLELADINGDGRADLCADSRAGLLCGLAP